MIVCVLGIVTIFAFTHFSYLWTAWQTGRLPVMTWGFFHYELNARYFAELGYTDLYACAHEADAEGNKLAQPDIKLRDLRTYEEVLPDQYYRCPRERFSEDRWRAFVRDTVELWHEPMWLFGTPFFENPTLYWNSITFDKGYNAPPPLVVLTQWSLQATDWMGEWQRGVLTLIDAGFLVAAFYVCKRVFGWRAMCASLAALFLYWGVREMVLGSLWQQVWFASILFMLACVRQKRWGEAGFWLGFAAMTRVFPVFFAIPFIMRWVQLSAAHNMEERRHLDRLFVVFAVTCATFAGIGLLAGRGFEAWPLFFEKMLLHSRYIGAEYFNVGWKNVVAILLAPNASELVRLELVERWNWLISLPALLVTGWMVYRYRYTSLMHWMLLTLPLLLLWVVISPYYLITVALIPLLLLAEPQEVSTQYRLPLLYGLAVYLLLTEASVEYSHVAYVQPIFLHLLTQGGLLMYLVVLTCAIPKRAVEVKT